MKCTINYRVHTYRVCIYMAKINNFNFLKSTIFISKIYIMILHRAIIHIKSVVLTLTELSSKSSVAVGRVFCPILQRQILNLSLRKGPDELVPLPPDWFIV